MRPCNIIRAIFVTHFRTARLASRATKPVVTLRRQPSSHTLAPRSADAVTTVAHRQQAERGHRHSPRPKRPVPRSSVCGRLLDRSPTSGGGGWWLVGGGWWLVAGWWSCVALASGGEGRHALTMFSVSWASRASRNPNLRLRDVLKVGEAAGIAPAPPARRRQPEGRVLAAPGCPYRPPGRTPLPSRRH